MDILVKVDGRPKGQPRARAFARKGMVRMYDPGTAEGWKGQVAAAVKAKLPDDPIDYPIRVDLLFIMPRPKGHYTRAKGGSGLKPGAPTWFSSKPDRDNLDKAVLDAFTQMGLVQDDALISVGFLAKIYCPPHLRPGAVIRIRSLTDQQHIDILNYFRSSTDASIVHS